VKNLECFHHFFIFKVKMLKQVLQRFQVLHLLFQQKKKKCEK
jgi:hypothetical protein